MGKIRVDELAAQMGIGSKEVLFLLQSIGVDVKSAQAALDESTVLAILQGKTHAPKQLIVRDAEARTVRPQKSALNRIKIIEKTAGPAGAPGEEAFASDAVAVAPPPSRATREAMWRHAGLERSAEGLAPLLEDEHPLARLVAACALSREETRGAHARSDFPGTASTLDGRHTVVDAAAATPRTEPWT